MKRQSKVNIGGNNSSKKKAHSFVHVKSIQDLEGPLGGESVVAQLCANFNPCFSHDSPMEPQDYYLRLVDFLHNDLTPLNTTRSRESSAKRPRALHKNRIEGLFGTIFRIDHDVEPITHLKNHWELFVLLDQGIPMASCMVQFHGIYQTAEIHEVCVGEEYRGQRLCQKLLSQVVDHLKKDKENERYVEEIRIYCENHNGAACKCYSGLFMEDANWQTHVRKSPYTTAFLYVRKNKA